MPNAWKMYVLVSAVALTAIGIVVWKKKKRTYVKVGKISKLYFYPVKSLKGCEVSSGLCTKFGFEVNGLLDRSFMLVSANQAVLTQRQAPRLVLLSAKIDQGYVTISGPSVEDLKVEIKQSYSPEDKLIDCMVFTDSVKGIDCGNEAAMWFESYLEMTGVRLVRFFPDFPLRKYTKNNYIFANMRKKHPAGFQDLAAFHVLSQASIDDLNSNIGEKKISLKNFRPNILFDGCQAFAEDSWKYIKFDSGAEMENLMLTTRCLLTTNDPETGILSQKEPLVTLRKYRIPKDPDVLKKTGALPCLGVSCAVLKSGEIKAGDDVYAVVEKSPQMVQK